jgi:menaquinone-9 beta-reductase
VSAHVASVAAEAIARCDVLVIGAGPAGAMAALRCARRGLRTMLVDKGPIGRDKVCGCCLTPVGAALLGHCALHDVLRDAGHLNRLRLMSGGNSANIGMPGYRVIARTALDKQLVDAARAAGAAWMDATSATVSCEDVVTLRRGEDVRSCTPACVVVADGIGGSSLREHDAFAWRVAKANRMGLGVCLTKPPVSIAHDELVMMMDVSGYVGLVVLPEGGVDMAAAAEPDAVRSAGGPAAWLARVITRAGGDASELQTARVMGTPLLTRTRSHVAAGRVLVAGDACGYVEPFTGEGMTWALSTGAAVAAFAERLARGDDASSVAAVWSTEHARLVASRHTSCGRVAAVVRSPLRHAAVAFAKCAPAAAASIARRVLARQEQMSIAEATR